ncbi:MAG: ATP-binding cassette domain-containing protein [Acidobacteriaceae bacterium]|nr:ATP-binding cassette domain-containing protein [Acidobacteriaceae bacterium]
MAFHGASVEFDGVTKRFESVTAVDDLSLSIPEGSIYGFIGPNGSGKTTTMRLITGILLPDRGDVRVYGATSSSRQLGSIGYLPEERGIYKKMTVRALLRFHAELRGVRKAAAQADAWLEKLDLAKFGSSSIETLSKGMTQKVQFIAAAIGEPKLLILDEPFSGLDPVSSQAIRSAILELRGKGATIVLSTHDMGTAEQMCERILMMFRGKKVLDGTLMDIRDRYGNDTVRISAENAACLAGLPGVEQIRDLGQMQEIRMARDADPQALLRNVMTRTRVDSFSIARPSLEDIFIRIAGADSLVDRLEAQSA